MRHSPSRSGRLLLAGTPIGDVRYVSEALREAILGADLIAAEDTRKFAELCRRAEIRPSAPVRSYFEGNEVARTPDLVGAMIEGRTVVLVSDAGMPTVSDPGYRLVNACIAAGIAVSAIPGPSAVLTALAVSGLATDRFCFEGFLPRKAGPRRSHLAELRREVRTMIFFEAPHRLGAFLEAASETFGPERPGALCRELTKTYEEVIRGPLSELIEWTEGEVAVRGEITIVIAGWDRTPASQAELLDQVRSLIEAGEKPSSAAAKIAAASGADRRSLYAALQGARSKCRVPSAL